MNSYYNKDLPNKSIGYSNICQYIEFELYCIEKSLSPIEILILKYILINSKDWKISPQQMSNKFNINRQTLSRAFTNLINKLNGDLVVVFRSNGETGSKVNASKVYDKIYNKIYQDSLPRVVSVEEEAVDEINDKQAIEVEEMPAVLRVKYQQYLNSPSWSKDNLIAWLEQNHIQYRIVA